MALHVDMSPPRSHTACTRKKAKRERAQKDLTTERRKLILTRTRTRGGTLSASLGVFSICGWKRELGVFSYGPQSPASSFSIEVSSLTQGSSHQHKHTVPAEVCFITVSSFHTDINTFSGWKEPDLRLRCCCQ